MSNTLKIYFLDDKYIDYLRKYDSKVPFNKNHTHPYIGIVYTFNKLNYFAPLSSPKPKHLKINNKAIDIFKIKDGKLGIVNINNMIPTPSECITEALPTIKDIKYKKLVEDQTDFINDHKAELLNKIRIFRLQLDKNHFPERVKERTCNFSLLESKCKEYIDFH